MINFYIFVSLRGLYTLLFVDSYMCSSCHLKGIPNSLLIISKCIIDRKS